MLNIINQLKAKNAFDKPEEPGITGANGNQNPNQSSGTSFGGGGQGGIR